MSERRKRNIIIISLCGVLLLMTIGYATFNTLLNINGTTSITSNWDIKITEITNKDIVGKATDEESQVVDDLSATFKVNLVSPGDSITYEITVENNGNIDAELEKINVNRKINQAINITYEGIEAGEVLSAGEDDVLTVKVEYDKNVTSQPSSTEVTFEMVLEYVEEGTSNEPTTEISETLVVGGQEVQIVKENDGLYEDTYEPGRYIYRGGNPDNYITFNGEQWRIIAIETDGAIKIMRNGTLLTMPFDEEGYRTDGYCSYAKYSGGVYGCNVWAATPEFDNHFGKAGGVQGVVSKDSSIKTYLNTTYYNSIVKNKSAIQNHLFYYGAVEDDTALAGNVEAEKKYSAKSNIGLIQTTDYLRANSNTASCSIWNNATSSTCPNTQWIHKSVNNGASIAWLISPRYYNTDTGGSSGVVHCYYSTGYPGSCNAKQNNFGVVPALYLKSNVQLTGKGTQNDPFTIENYLN